MKKLDQHYVWVGVLSLLAMQWLKPTDKSKDKAINQAGRVMSLCSPVMVAAQVGVQAGAPVATLVGVQAATLGAVQVVTLAAALGAALGA
ncbi:hypothetical protein, partial [Delftia deserti]